MSRRAVSSPRPTVVDSAAGTLAEPTTLTAALTRIGAGHTIYLRGGTYAYAVQITIAARQQRHAGRQPKTLAPYMDEKPVLDFSSQPYGSERQPARPADQRQLLARDRLDRASGSADNGIYVAGNHNVIERCITHGNRDTGLQLGRARARRPRPTGPADNLILNCESYDNYDGPPGGRRERRRLRGQADGRRRATSSAAASRTTTSTTAGTCTPRRDTGAIGARHHRPVHRPPQRHADRRHQQRQRRPQRLQARRRGHRRRAHASRARSRSPTARTASPGTATPARSA